MDQMWGPWIELDGSGMPEIAPGTRFECKYVGDGMIWPDGHEIMDTWPGFFWSWRRVKVNWFESERRRVCDQPEYAPIIRIRFLRPPASAVDRLAEIAADPYAPPLIVSPEGPVRQAGRVQG